ncbi:hypothetical protein Tco_0971119 [Tanacetum coccineum]
MPTLGSLTLRATRVPGGDSWGCARRGGMFDVVSPIAVGTVWRRLVSKVASSSIGNSMNTYLHDFQFGVGIPGGCEAVLHSVNRLIESKGNEVGLSMLLVDFKNAFNLVDRGVLLRKTGLRLPSISPWVEFCYARPARLYYDDSVLWSCQGVQQGDPLGPLLFALALHPLVQTINQSCELTLQAWYLDDGTIVGDTLMVAKALDIIKTDGPARGLFLNVDKTELFWPVEDPRSRMDGVFPINISRPLNGVKLLGGSVSLDEGFCRDLALKRVSKTISLMEAIHKLHDPQCELLLLRLATNLVHIRVSSWKHSVYAGTSFLLTFRFHSLISNFLISPCGQYLYVIFFLSTSQVLAYASGPKALI